jgi:hypothetical protein
MLIGWMMAAALAGGNLPDDAPRGAFRIATVAFHAPVPEGFCLPEGKDAAAAQLVAAADRDNVTHLTVVHCDEKRRWTDYFLIKTPTAALMATMTNAELQQALEPILIKGLDSDAITKSASEQLSGTLQSKIDLKGRIEFLGKDDSCLYLGGVLNLKGEADGSGYTLAMAQCITVVEGKALTVYRYGDGEDRKAVEALMPSARAFAKAIRPASAQ